MQLVLADASISVLSDVRGPPRVVEARVDDCHMYSSLLASNDDKEMRYKLVVVTEIAKAENFSKGSSSIIIQTTLPGNPRRVDISVRPSLGNRSIFKHLAQMFQEKVKISVFLRWRLASWINTDEVASIEGMKIDPESFTCTGTTTTVQNFDLKYTMIYVKLTATIDITASIAVSYSQKILEGGAFSDLTICAANGAKIKAHKCFVSVCSPVLGALLESGMEESHTGQIGMNDLSEEGVRAFLRYVYHGDLKEAMDNIQIAYELFYAGHKYDVPVLEAEMRTHLMKAKNKNIGGELAFQIYMFTKNISTAVELKTKTFEILSVPVKQVYASDSKEVSGLETDIEKFLALKDNEDLDVDVAFKMYLFSRDIESAVEMKKKALRVLKDKVDELESLKEYNELFEKPINSKTAKELCKDLVMTASSGCTCIGNAERKSLAP